MMTTSYPRFEGDVSGIFIFRLSEALRAVRVDLDVVTPSDNGTTAKQPTPATKAHRFRYFYPRSLQGLAYGAGGGIPANMSRHPWLLLQLPFFILTFVIKTMQVAKGAQVLHANWIYVGGIAWVVSYFRGIPFMVTLRGSDVRLSEKGLILRAVSIFFLKRAALVTTVNHDFREWVVAQGVKEDRVRVIRNGVVLPTLKSRSTEISGCQLLFVGNLIPGKGLLYLLEALSSLELKKTDVQLTVVGTGAQKEDLLQRVKTDGLEDRVHFVGGLPPEKMSDLMMACDCLVLPSLSEGTPNVVLEAMACALPVVASDLPGVRELVTPGVDGLLVEPRDVKALSEALLTLIQDQSLRQGMGKAGRETIVKMGLSWQKTALQYQECYQEVCAASQDNSI